MRPRIGILTYRSDSHGHCVKQKIEARHDAWCCLIPSDELALRGGLTWSSADEPARLPTLDGDPVDVRTLDALWYRRTSSKQPLPDGVDPAYEPHIYRSIERTLEGLLLEEFRGRWVSHPVATQLAENKLVQLRAAQRAGLRIPATLISQDPASIRRFCGAAHPGAILKPVTTPRGVEVTKTAVVSDALLANDDVLALAPSIYQEHIPGTRHLRITLFGDRCIGALITAEDLDWRLDLTVPFQPHPVDEPLERMLRATLRDLGLVMGIFDVKLTPAGEPVFLEVNSQGQFLFVEALCGVPLGDAFAAFLVGEATASSAAGSSRSIA